MEITLKVGFDQSKSPTHKIILKKDGTWEEVEIVDNPKPEPPTHNRLTGSGTWVYHTGCCSG